MTTFFQLLGFSLIAGAVLTAAFWPLLWVSGVFQTPPWAEAILTRISGMGSGPIAKTKV